MLKAALDELTKNVKKAPGWVPLSITCYLLFRLIFSDKTFFGISLAEHRELIVLAATLILYVLGDALDGAIFDRISRRLRKLNQDRTSIKDTLLMDEGYYDVAKALVVAARRYDGTWIQVKNESAKFLRSVGCLTAILAVALAVRAQFIWALLLLPITLLLIASYVLLKAAHMSDIYLLVTEDLARREDQYSVQELPNGVRLFFWEGKLASSAPRADKNNVTLNGVSGVANSGMQPTASGRG